MSTQLDRLLAIPEISDSTDFPDTTTAPGLRGLDDAVRCDICRDFYDAPVSLNCGHSFCSGCIRSALPISAICPTCRKEASEVNLRKNLAIERAVHAWKIARPLILRLTLEEHERKTRPEGPRLEIIQRGEPPRKRKRSGTPSNASENEIIDLASSSPAPSGSEAAPTDALPDTVDCPICQKAVPSQKINMHIDSNCKRHLAENVLRATPLDPKGKQREQWSKLLGDGGASTTSGKGKGKAKGKTRAKAGSEDAEPEHLPKVAYDIHPQKRIVQLLNEWGLSTHGDKNALVRRHSKWIIMYNANVDRALENRKTVEQLRNDLRRAEEAEHKTRKEIIDDPVAYQVRVGYTLVLSHTYADILRGAQKANKAAFAKLTEAARPKKTIPPDPPEAEGSTAAPAPTADVVDIDNP
ncbi:hypothetical protein C2E23DRAFT_287840 [Lenzites betulinus]|nr:hypothetical protein C2E23DRAFT_287840 [Lenzites betulinus]